MSDFLVNPSIKKSAQYVYHIQYGRPLDLPVSASGYIQSGMPETLSTDWYPSYGNSACLSDEHIVCRPFTGIETSFSLPAGRWGLEPHWTVIQGDASVIFRYQVQGITRLSIPPDEIMSWNEEKIHRVPCTCAGMGIFSTPDEGLSVLEEWLEMNFAKLRVIGDLQCRTPCATRFFGYHCNSDGPYLGRKLSNIPHGRGCVLVARPGRNGIEQPSFVIQLHSN